MFITLYNFILPKNKYTKIKGDLSVMYLMLNFDDKKNFFVSMKLCPDIILIKRVYGVL